MKFNIEAKTFLAAFKLAGKNRGKGTEPFNGQLLLSLEGETLAVASCDGSTTLTLSLPAGEGAGEGTIALPAGHITGITEQLVDIAGDAVLEADDATAEIAWDGGSCRMPVYDAAPWPAPRIPDEEAATLALPAAGLLAGLLHTLYAVETNELLEAITAVNVRCSPEGVVLCTTDRATLATWRLAAPEGCPTASFSIPAAAAALLVDVLKAADGDVAVACDGKSLSFTGEGWRMCTYAVRHAFPAYETILGRERGTNTARVDRETLRGMVRRLHVVAGNATGKEAVHLSFAAGALLGATLTASAGDEGRGAASTETSAIEYEGADLEIHFSAARLEALLKAYSCEAVRMEMSDASSPCFFGDAAGEEPWTTVLMPVRGE